MLTVPAEKHRYCDGLTRRSFLQIGGLAMGGLSLPALLSAEQKAGIRRSQKAIIMVYLSGGLAHQDSFDLKPEAPDEVRGEFKPIATRVPGAHPHTFVKDLTERPIALLPSTATPIRELI